MVKDHSTFEPMPDSFVPGVRVPNDTFYPKPGEALAPNLSPKMEKPEKKQSNEDGKNSSTS
ncbi:hypothetical protein FAI41_02460 [Acetobacteraceae bacterium]|nr:hypothetical protein FAI41_02460 [Acetobacteraceae bacterium]